MNEQVSITEKKFDQQIDLLKISLSQSNTAYKNLERESTECLNFEKQKSDALAIELNNIKVKEKTLLDVCYY